MNALNKFMDFVDSRAIVRRIAFFVMLWITVKASFWTIEFAWYSSRPGMEIAAIIAAVWTPLSGLQAAVFAFYDKGRNTPQTANVQ